MLFALQYHQLLFKLKKDTDWKDRLTYLGDEDYPQHPNMSNNEYRERLKIRTNQKAEWQEMTDTLEREGFKDYILSPSRRIWLLNHIDFAGIEESENRSPVTDAAIGMADGLEYMLNNEGSQTSEELLKRTEILGEKHNSNINYPWVKKNDTPGGKFIRQTVSIYGLHVLGDLIEGKF